MRLFARFALLAATALLAGRASAQVIRGRVIDAATKAPVPLVEARLLAANDSVLSSTLTSDSGAFVLRGHGDDRYAVELRRLGFDRLMTTHVRLAPGDTMRIELELARSVTISLDTMRVEERRPWWTSTTRGRTFLLRHAQRGLGVFVAGSLVERSGMLLSEYLGRIEGLLLTPVIVRGHPVVPARNGMFLTSTFASRCLYARVDRQSLAQYLISARYESLDEALKLNQIAAIEIYRDRSEIPDEWSDAGFVRDMFYRKNGGIEYLLGHPGNSTIPDGILQDDAFGARSATRALITNRRTDPGTATTPPNLNNAKPDMTALVTRENLNTPQCGLLQIWTNSAW